MFKGYLEGLKGYRYLLSFKNYKNSEIFLKTLFMPVVLPIFTVLFLIALILYTIERLLAPFFQKFLVFQMKMIQKRAHAHPWSRRGWSLLTLIVTLILLPFVMTYYISMVFKSLAKHLMKAIILKLDFSVQYTYQNIELFDDKDKLTASPLNSMMSDAANTEDISKIFAQYFENYPELSDEDDIIDDDSHKNQ